MFCLLAALLVFFHFTAFILILLIDCDLILWIYSKFGKKPEEALGGKVVWITGASSGIGEELAYQLAKVGAVKLVLSSRNESALRTVKEKCLALNHLLADDSILVVPIDLTEYDTHQPTTQKVLQHFSRIDILVNNGGQSQRYLFAEGDFESSCKLVNLNLLGTISLTRVVLAHMLESGAGGHIVSVSSVAGKLGTVLSSTYSATKFGLLGFFDALRGELSNSNVRVTSICPGPVISGIEDSALVGNRDMTVQGKMGRPVAGSSAKMATARCVELMIAAIANRLSEVWITPNPILLFVYVNQYFPNFAKLISTPLYRARIRMFKSGKAADSAFSFKKTN